MKSMKQLISVLALAGAMVLATMYALTELYQAHNQYLKENQCVRKHIADGIERSDIATANGKCWIESNGYYN